MSLNRAMDLLLTSTNSSSCIWDCDLTVDLGPPPDLIAALPPPPIPTFLRDPVDYLMAANGSCDLCRWARGDDVQLVEVTRKYDPLADDMWYFVVVSAVVGAVLFAILVVIAMLRCKEAKVKPVLHDGCSKVEKKVQPPPTQVVEATGPKALWSSGVGGYSLHHHPFNPELLQAATYERIDYGAVGSQQQRPPFRPMGPPPTRTLPPPPPPLIPPPPIPTSTGRRLPYVHDDLSSSTGNEYYESLAAGASFENGGFVDSECSLEVLKVAPDGAVVGRRRGPSMPRTAGGGSSWEEAVIRQRFVGRDEDEEEQDDEDVTVRPATKYTMTVTNRFPPVVRPHHYHQVLPPPVPRFVGFPGASSPLV